MTTLLLLRGARVIDPVTKKDRVLDLLIESGTFARIAPKISAPAGAEVIDCAGKIAAPGFFDMHVHFREPGQTASETIATGMDAAAAGGFTGVLMMPNTAPAIDSAHLVEFVLGRARGGAVEVHTTGCITKERAGSELAPIGAMVKAGARAFTDDGAAVMSSGVMRRAFEYASMFDALLIQHAEEHTLTHGGCMNEGTVSTALGMPGMPAVAEEIIVARDILLAGAVGHCRYHVAHLSTAGGVALIRAAKKNKLAVSAEVTPHHLLLTEEAVRTLDPNTRMNPPLRTMRDVEAVREGLRDGTIDVIATDHAPHAQHLKDCDFACSPFGIIGLETAIGICITTLIEPKILTWSKLIEKLSVNPRRLLRLPEIRIAEGEEANLTLIDPAAKWTVGADTIRSKSRNTPFLGMKLTGKAVGIVRGKKLKIEN